MQPTPERNELSPIALAGIGLAVLVTVAALVFIGGTILTSGNDDEEVATDATSSDDSDQSDSSDNTDSDEPNNDNADSDDPDGSTTTANGDDQTNDDDPSTTETTTPSTTAATGTTPDSSGSDFCEAGTRNNVDIMFDPGASTSQIADAATPGEIDLYNLAVGQGQIINIILMSLDAEIELSTQAPDGSIELGDFGGTTIAPSQAGNYRICVAPGSARADYTLNVSVIDDNTPTKVDAPWCGSSVNDRGEIRFSAGSSSGEVENAVIRGERDLYTFDAGEGQAVDLLLTSLEDNAVFSSRAPDGELLIDEVSDFRLPLPLSGTYEVCIGGTRGNASYTLTLGIG